MDYLPYIVAAVVGYLLGSVPCGYLVAKSHGVDIFKVGSGNPGSTNVKRVLGSKAGNTVFAFDILKGVLATGWIKLYWLVCAGHLFHAEEFTPLKSPTMLWMGLAGVVAAVIGHCFSVFTKFKGGKGVATAAGGLVVLMPYACLTGAALWMVAFYSTRYVSLASILAAIAVPAASWILGNPLPLNIVATVIGLFVIIRHRANIGRLLSGTENRFVKKANPPGDKEKPGA